MASLYFLTKMKQKLPHNKRRFLFKYHYYRGLYKCIYPPLNIRIEPTNRCNLKCVMCPNGNLDLNNSNSGFINMDLFNKIILQARSFPHPTGIFLYLGGEPLMHKDISKLITLSKENGLMVALNSNATLLTEKRTFEILESGLDQITFSFDDVTPSEYEGMRRNAKYEKTLQNLLFFLEQKNRLKKESPQVSIASLRLRTDNLNMNEPLEANQEFTSLFSKYPVTIYRDWAHMWAGESYRKMIYTYKRTNTENHLRCMLPWRDLTINYLGQAVACCYDLSYDYVLGDANNMDLMDIWNSEKMMNLRKICFSGSYEKINLCSSCSYVFEGLKSDLGGKNEKYWNMIQRKPKTDK